MDKLISIIVPIYNVQSYLDKCISSILTQTYKHLQIILVDDGSTDASGKICDSYAQKDERILVIHKENGGLVSARKAGIQAAVGEYVGYVDGDDWIEHDMYEQLIHAINTYDADMVETNHYLDMSDECLLITGKIDYGCYDSKELIPFMLCDENFNECNLKPFVWSKLYKREMLHLVQMPVDEDISFGEDVAVTYPYILACKKVVIADYAGYHYVQRKDSIVNSRKCDELYCNMALISYLEKRFTHTDAAETLLPALNQYAKTLMLLRDSAYFDERDGKEILSVFGGISKNEKVIIYGAGKVGQNLYRYLKTFRQIEVLAWLDREAGTYQKWGLPVQAPEKISDYSDTDCKVMIAISNRKTAMAIKQYLRERNIEEHRIRWLTEEFVQSRRAVFEMCTYKSIAICGFGMHGKVLYKRLLENGYSVPYIIECNEDMDGLQAAGKEDFQNLKPVGLDKEADFYKTAEVVLVSDDVDFQSIRRNMRGLGFPVQILPQSKECVICSGIKNRPGTR